VQLGASAGIAGCAIGGTAGAIGGALTGAAMFCDYNIVMIWKKSLLVFGLFLAIIALGASILAFLSCTKFYNTDESWRFYVSLISVLIFGTITLFNLTAFLLLFFSSSFRKFRYLQ